MNKVNTCKLINHQDFRENIDGNNYIAKASRECCYTEIVSEKNSIDYDSGYFIFSHLFADHMYDYPFDEHRISYINRKAFIIYKRQMSDCCQAKRGEIVVCVAYTNSKYRNQGLMMQLLQDLSNKYKNIVIDTNNETLISICKKIKIKSFKNNF